MGNDHALEISDELGCKTHIANGIMKIVRGTLVVIKGEKIAANLYILKGETLQDADSCVASTSRGEEQTMMWHHKVGHMSERGLKILSDQKLFPGLNSIALPFCEYCVTSKQHRLKFNISSSRSNAILELVHFDVWQAPITFM
ncbi:uncharacterized protein LOC109821189 [Asparagus officinalis]|uniref:uncharacterized protein LOC109821189 n=1 Tax=Asparagus officinalis TaxID=4686 RepID=UPI00098E3D38|nr:uncharacterized protein LOC109821189 [Asparagus officinalis]